jgi:hypothetical protein
MEEIIRVKGRYPRKNNTSYVSIHYGCKLAFKRELRMWCLLLSYEWVIKVEANIGRGKLKPWPASWAAKS